LAAEHQSLEADQQVFQKLIEDARHRRLVPFVGAGFSRCLNAEFPNWSDRSKPAAKLMGYDPDVLEAIATHYQIGEMLRKEQGLIPFYG
jgi:hypothetical protein